jgi:hypothetical protein
MILGDLMKYEAVTKEDLVKRLGYQCSPMAHREGYVIGPDINGRLCHCATCFSMKEAKEKAEIMNNHPNTSINRSK